MLQSISYNLENHILGGRQNDFAMENSFWEKLYSFWNNACRYGWYDGICRQRVSTWLH